MRVGRARVTMRARVARLAQAIAGALSGAERDPSHLERILDVTRALSSSLDLPVVLERVLAVAGEVLAADAVLLYSYDADRHVVSPAMGRGALTAELLKSDFAPGDDLIGKVVMSGEAAYLDDVGSSDCELARTAASAGLCSVIAAPLRTHGACTGVLVALSREVRAFSEEDRAILSLLASQAALASDTARLYARERDIATILKDSLVPADELVVAGLEIGSVYAPLGVDTGIGGDYFDVLSRGAGETWFAIADVCGKGVRAATKAAMIKFAVRALVQEGVSPAAVLARVNQVIVDAGSTADIVTVWLGRLDMDGLLTWADGGHPPGFLVRNGEVRELSVTGPLLGAAPEVTYTDASVQTEPGDRIVLYTDGVTEARKGREFFGEARLREVIAAPCTAQSCADLLFRAVSEYVSEQLRDDVAVLVVEIPAAGRM